MFELVNDEQATTRFILTTAAEWSLRSLDSATACNRIRDLARIVGSEQQVDQCIAALKTAHHILTEQYDTDCARDLLVACRILARRELTQAQEALTAAKELAIAHVVGDSLERVRPEILAAEALRQGHLHFGTTTSIAVDMSLGCSRTAAGDYAAGATYFHRAYDESVTLGNPSATARSASNLALVYDRTGDFDQALHWARIGLSAAEICRDPASFKLIHSAAWALAMKGQGREALEMLLMEKRFGEFSQPLWVTQASLMLTSDLRWVLGRTNEAVEYALDATSGKFTYLLARSYAGPYCRVLARSGLATGTGLVSRHRIRETVQAGGWLDAIDCADIYSAELLLCLRLGLDLEGLPEKLSQAWLAYQSLFDHGLRNLDLVRH